MAHLLGVCALVQHDGGDEDEAIAALLHDALEDKPDLLSAEAIEERFGNRVLQLVRVSTDTPADYAVATSHPGSFERKPIWRTSANWMRRIFELRLRTRDRKSV